jgi:hypothetical protein
MSDRQRRVTVFPAISANRLALAVESLLEEQPAPGGGAE